MSSMNTEWGNTDAQVCSSVLIATGQGRQSLASFVDEDRVFQFGRVTPIPDAAYVYGLSQWHQKYWGCPDVGVVVTQNDNGSDLLMRILTLGTPPIPIVKTLIERYPHLSFVMIYKGQDFKGRIEGKNGVVTSERFSDESSESS